MRRTLNLVSLGLCSDPAWVRTRARDLVAHYVTAFVLSELNDDVAARAALAPALQHFPGVGYRAEGY